MITLQNMIFANPQAYRVFPQIANPYNTGITDTAIFTGYIQITDSNGTTKSFSNTNTIDFSGFSGTIDIDQYTDTGSVKLGRWNIGETTPDEPDEPADVWRMRVIASDTFDSMPADGVVITGTQDQTYWVRLQAYNEAQQKVVDIPSSHIEDVTKYGGKISMTVTSFTSNIIDGKDAMTLALTLDRNPDMEVKTASINVQFRLTREDCEQLLGSTTMMGWFGSADYAITQLAQPYISPYTPAISMALANSTASGSVATAITNGLQINQTGGTTGDQAYHFFAYTEELSVGETYYAATIGVTGMPKGYTIQGIRGWDSLTITQDGEYTIPEFTCPEQDMGDTIAYDSKPALMFASTVPANITLDTPITIVITSVDEPEDTNTENNTTE